MTDLYAATSKHLLLRQYPAAISTVHALVNDLRSRHPFVYNRTERPTSSNTPALLVQWESYPYSTIQALKLLCTVYVSAWSGGLSGSELLRKTKTASTAGGKRQDGARDVRLEALAKCLPPNSTSPTAILETTLGICLQTLVSSQPPHLNQNKILGRTEDQTPPVLALPPSLLLTFLLACIKIYSSSETSRSSSGQGSRQDDGAIPFARKLFEDWLAILPDEVLYALSQARPMRTPRKARKTPVQAPLDTSTSSLASSAASLDRGNPSDSSPSASTVLVETPSSDEQDRSFLLQFKKDYLRLVEVYVLEVLPRQDDWDIASDFVMGEFVMGAKRKEQMLKRLHDAKAKQIASVTRARRSSGSAGRGGGPNSMTALSSSSAADGEDIDAETVLASGAGSRSISRRSSDASTERTARPYDRASRPGRGHVIASDVADSQTQDPSRLQTPEDVRRPHRDVFHTTDSVSSNTPTHSSAFPEQSGKGPVTRAVSSFAALRSRIIEYLDEPLSEPRSPTNRARNLSGGDVPRDHPRRNRRNHSTTSWNVLKLLRPKSLATIAALVVLLLAGRRWRRKNRQQSVGNTGGNMPLWYILGAQWWREALMLAWNKLRLMVSMGTTLTYV